MNNYKILEKGNDDKVLVEWDKSNDSGYKFVTGSDKEYSVHTLSLNGGLIWGHYYNKKEDAEKHFKKYRR